MTLKSLKLPSTSGENFSFAEYKGKKVILYFYPKDNTPGCTQEGLDFGKKIKLFQKLNTVIFGVSRDSLKSHEKFKQKMAFPFDLLSDEKEEACKLFDVIKWKNMYGKKVLGIERSTFLFDEKGKTLKEWRKIKVAGHVNEVLAFLKSIA